MCNGLGLHMHQSVWKGGVCDKHTLTPGACTRGGQLANESPNTFDFNMELEVTMNNRLLVY